MIKINLLQVKKRKALKIPFGWIIVVGYALAACGFLYLASEQKASEIATLEEELTKAQVEVKNFKRFSEQKALKRKEFEKLTREKGEYDRILASSGGGWTVTLLLFEDVLKASKTVWFRDLRIEGDGRVSITGKSKENPKTKLRHPGITDMLDAFRQKETQFKTVRLKRIQKEPDEQNETVATFELVCVLTR